MDGTVASNPQHSYSLSHALNPALTTARPHSPYASYSTDPRDGGATTSAHIDGHPREEEEEEEEEDEVEGAVNLHTGGSAGDIADGHASQSTSLAGRRRPGRPKGSKNKKPRYDMSTPAPAKPPFSTQPFFGFPQTPPGAVPMQPPPPPPPPPVIMPQMAGDPNTQQQFFDFQWRVLTLCSEFYNAADELIRGAPPHVVSQCYSLPGNHVDPLSVLHEARRACDQLMANPSQNILKVPPVAVTFNSDPQVKTGSPSTTPPTGVITNPGSFVMSLNSSAPSTAGFNSITPPRYPTSSYYAYATTTSHSTSSHPYLQQQQVMKPVNLTTPAAAGNQGAWSDEETDKLRKLADDSRGQSNPDSREIDWDWVCNNWGPGRTRHQILIKATNISLKESSTRGVKKKRDSEPTPAAEGHVNSITSPGAPPTAPPSTAAGPPDRPASTSISAHQSPALTHAVMSTPTSSTSATMMGNWPMPHVAANTPSPVISSSAQPSVGRTPYYRSNERPTVGK